jgi:hypothetical protein
MEKRGETGILSVPSRAVDFLLSPFPAREEELITSSFFHFLVSRRFTFAIVFCVIVFSFLSRSLSRLVVFLRDKRTEKKRIFIPIW